MLISFRLKWVFCRNFAKFDHPVTGRRLIFQRKPMTPSCFSNSVVSHSRFFAIYVQFQGFCRCVRIWCPKMQVKFRVNFPRTFFRNHSFRFLKAQFVVVNYVFQSTSWYFFRASSLFLGALPVGKLFGPGTFSKKNIS